MSANCGFTRGRPDLLAHRHRIRCARQPGRRWLAEHHSGAVIGIGFIGGGIVFRRTIRTGELISGITTAAAVFATAAIGAAAGAGLLAVAALATALVLFTLEGPHIPFLKLLDARRRSPHFRADSNMYRRDDDTAVLPDDTASHEDDRQPTSSRT